VPGECRIDEAQLRQTTIYRKPYAFIDEHGSAVVIRPYREARRGQLVRMYLDYGVRDQFSGLPPIREAERIRWVEEMIRHGTNLLALSFDAGVVGHGGLFPIDGRRCEILVALDARYRDRGIGTQLVHQLLRLAHELDFESIWLNVDRANRRAQRVYAKNGFRYVASDGHDEFEMIADLRHFSHLADVPVAEVMNRHVVSIGDSATCREALAVIVRERVGTLPVVDHDGHMIGLLSETDLLGAGCLDLLACDVCTRQVVAVRPHCGINQLVRLFQTRKMRCIPVLDETGYPVGIVGRRDILARYVSEPGGAAPRELDPGGELPNARPGLVAGFVDVRR
jgi:RimJ/RimL family protein N-acetyltransferase/CBS domain-containing protein